MECFVDKCRVIMDMFFDWKFIKGIELVFKDYEWK